ncbi:MAG: hypothetical protein IPJ61_20265 [Tessaracoccus sp.]|uniref:hypothetical protein n=1 Tax=Tessaracoccus sp. TaxID=1971211 RepID=UPI001EB27EBE|nr:hypothetical protein [Tessaracoccus sp.]MBK7823323.1 hypothetical protein [Tessaracoccus sp.]
MDRRDRIAAFGNGVFPEGTEFNEARMVALVPVEMLDGEDGDGTVAFRLVYEVCGTCNGRGSHVNPGVDAHGITAEEFDEDPEFREEYFAGSYDVTCCECQGRRVVAMPDDANNAPELMLRLHAWQREERSSQREREAEMRCGW